MTDVLPRFLQGESRWLQDLVGRSYVARAHLSFLPRLIRSCFTLVLRDAWLACQDADVLIESPSAMAGIHIAEGLGIPYMRAFTMPWTRTSAYPQAFMVPAVPMGPGFNYSTYVLFDNIMWKATAGQVNKWRRKLLKLPNTDLGKLGQTKVPFMYNFSSYVVSKPLDWHDDIQITGYWTLANSDSDWSPPDDLEEFMNKADEDGKPLVYIGFGSITVPDPVKMTEEIVRAVDRAGVRAIIAKGWSSRGGKGGDSESSPQYSSNCYALDKVPHGWLFPRVKAVVHHGGAGTVGASLSWGKPTIIRPWFGDQYFWAGRVQKLGVGLRVDNLGGDDLVNALQTATTDTVMIEKAAKIGEKIRAEDGVKNAIEVSCFPQ
jgi:sterol 3beta-glucosyltransferase